ncbi:MAG TPA: divalent-cation tolerance protein CutA [Saprospiraceae bacterium]|jgi:periplasmic divalent cation tolerance protein|nr:divalent-cation tolerance protein CutA [Saprospiraceae bacterium]
MDLKIMILYIPFPDEKSATKMAQGLLEQKLAACTQIFSAHSMYPWNDKIQKSSESILLVKTFKKKSKALGKFILKNHPYDLPCIIRTTAWVNEEYHSWMHSVVD